MAVFADYDETGACQSGFACGKRRCIDSDLQCDGVDHCGDYSDEQAMGRAHCGLQTGE